MDFLEFNLSIIVYLPIFYLKKKKRKKEKRRKKEEKKIDKWD